MQLEFLSCNAVKCNRLCNKVADCLATYAACLLASGSHVFWCQAQNLLMAICLDAMPNAVVFPYKKKVVLASPLATLATLTLAMSSPSPFSFLSSLLLG
jgi:hypothetical protein